MNKIYIHRGDCTIFANAKKFLTFYIDTDLDLTGWTAEFTLYTVKKTVTDISNKQFEIILGANDTKELKLGTWNGAITLTDADGNIKTVINTIPFEVTKEVVENQYQEIDLTIPESSGVDIKLKVGASTVTSVNGMTGDVVIEIPSLEGYIKDTDYASYKAHGVVKINTTFGINANASGEIYNIKASDDEITGRSSSYKPIVPKSLDLAVKTGVTTNTLELTADEKASAKQWLGYAEPTDIMQAIASIPQFKLSIVDELPLAGEKMTLYLVPKEGTNNDVYDEYIWIEQTSSFEHLGTTAVDLTDYVKNTDYAGIGGKAGVIKVSATYGFAVAPSNGYLAGISRTLEQFEALQSNSVISKGTLDNVLTQYSKTVLTTEADYEALETKDSNTLYLIEE